MNKVKLVPNEYEIETSQVRYVSKVPAPIKYIDMKIDMDLSCRSFMISCFPLISSRKKCKLVIDMYE